MTKPISLDGIKMHVISTAEGGEVNTDYSILPKTVRLLRRDIAAVK